MVEIRPAQAGEGQALFDVTWAAIQAQAVGFYPAAQIANWMGARDAAFYEAAIAAGRAHVAVSDGVVGFVDTVPGELLRLYVRPAAFGQGIGRRLLRVGVTEALLGGEVRLEATLHAEGFYARHGFEALERAIYPNELGGLPLEVVKMVFRGRDGKFLTSGNFT